MNHGARVGRRARNNGINGKFLNAWRLLYIRPIPFYCIYDILYLS